MNDGLEDVEAVLDGEQGSIAWMETGKNIGRTLEAGTRKAARTGAIKTAYPLLGAGSRDFQENLAEREPAYNSHSATTASGMTEMIIGCGVMASPAVYATITGETVLLENFGTASVFGSGMTTVGHGLYRVIRGTDGATMGIVPSKANRQRALGALGNSYDTVRRSAGEVYDSAVERIEATLHEFDEKYVVRK